MNKRNLEQVFLPKLTAMSLEEDTGSSIMPLAEHSNMNYSWTNVSGSRLVAQNLFLLTGLKAK
jgi:hypothetical protein